MSLRVVGLWKRLWKRKNGESSKGGGHGDIREEEAASAPSRCRLHVPSHRASTYHSVLQPFQVTMAPIIQPAEDGQSLPMEAYNVCLDVILVEISPGSCGYEARGVMSMGLHCH